MSDRSEAVLRALSDPHRRAMLDALRADDGQSVTALGAVAPQLGRHAVLKHLGVLQDAGLVTTRKVGRQRLAYLNAVPLVELARRWLDDFGAQWGLALNQLRDHVENAASSGDAMSENATRVFSIVIAASRQQVWDALTDPDQTERWYFSSRVSLGQEPGSALEYTRGDEVILAGEVIECDPPNRLKATFHARWMPEVAADAPTVHTWDLEDDNGLTRLTLTHEQLVPGSATEQQVVGGWPYLLSGLKTLVETGRTLEETVGAAAAMGAGRRTATNPHPAERSTS